jgi:hypothetical protein
MKTLMTLALMVPLMSTAQTDTAAAEENEKAHALEISTGGVSVVEIGDSATVNDGYDTIRLELKHKIITILTSPRVEARTTDAEIDEKLKDLRRERRNKFTYWSGLDLGLNNWMTPDGSFDLDSADSFMELETGGSRFVAINFMEQKIEFGSHHAGLLTGLGVEWCNYLLTNNVTLGYNSDSTYAVEVDDPHFKKNKLRQTGLRLPLMLEFNTKRAPLPSREEVAKGTSMSYDRKGNFHIAVGVIGSWYFDTMYKQKYTRDGETVKDRSGGSYNLNPWRAAASVRIGYGGLNLFAEYALTPLFEDDLGPDLVPVNVGLTLIGFN